MARQCDCNSRNSYFNRREFLQVGATGALGFFLTNFFRPAEVLAELPVKPLGTARACIFILLAGGPSHIDTFDLKEGAWTPPDFDIRSFDGGIVLPYALFPNLASQLGRVAILRSVEGWDNQHDRAVYYIQTARAQNPAFVKEVPHIGAVVALEYDQRRKDGDILPPFVALNSLPIGQGFLSALYAPFAINPSLNGIPGLTHPQGEARFIQRFDLLKALDAYLRGPGAPQKVMRDFDSFYARARDMMYNPVIAEAFAVPRDDYERYGSTSFGISCITARNLVASDRGTHFIFISLGGWDMHSNIYNQSARVNIYSQSRALDLGLANLISDLAGRPGSVRGKSLLDETLIVAMGDFGRTPAINNARYNGGINSQGGRDHYKDVQFVLFAGGGVKGGRAIGASDETGSKVIDFGWSEGRTVRMEDVATTIYSALGINWTKEILDTPSGRKFEYVPYGALDVYKVIKPLFE